MSDVFRYKGRVGVIPFLAFMLVPGCQYLFCIRVLQATSMYNPFHLIFRIIKHLLSVLYGIQIPKSVKLGEGFYIGHYGTIVVNGKVRIGNNCNISHNVTIGRTNRGSKKGTPTIHNRVWIGAGAVIVGEIKINDDVLIAPNSFVNFDVPQGSIVIGNPGKIIRRERAIEGYINNIWT